MSLVDYIMDELTPTQKLALYQEQAVCICIFRMVFSSTEQQLLHRLMFQDKVFNLLDLKSMLYVKTSATKIGATTVRTTPQQVDLEQNQANRQQDSIANGLISKLEKLELVSENIGASPMIPTLIQNPSIGRPGSVMNTP